MLLWLQRLRDFGWVELYFAISFLGKPKIALRENVHLAVEHFQVSLHPCKSFVVLFDKKLVSLQLEVFIQGRIEFLLEFVNKALVFRLQLARSETKLSIFESP